MIKEIDISITANQKDNPQKIKELINLKTGLPINEIIDIKILRRSIDARHGKIAYNLKIAIGINEIIEKPAYSPKFKNLSKIKVIIVGSGPAGLFAALKCLELGIKPIILERGHDVHTRKRDIAQMYKNQELNKNSNYCFGEGGAGTFSDGKLYTRSTKRGDVNEILYILNYYGANNDILIDAHPHIGSDKLPQIIENIREGIKNNGGEIHFNTSVKDLIINNSAIKGVISADDKEYIADDVILATGHSAHDIYNMLFNLNIALKPKGFAMGVRVEHPQTIIDQIQYSLKGERPDYLPSATYNLVSQIDGRGVYSFCMCPGGFIVPASTSEGQKVINGMSPSHRNSNYANSGIVVEIKDTDIKELGYKDDLGGLDFQNHIEKLAYNNGGNGLVAPGQRLTDFIKGKLSSSLPSCSYIPGIISSPVSFWLPDFFSKRLIEGFKAFDKKMHGFLTNEAIIVGVESRTSSPVQILRDSITLQSISIENLFPCGEGAGYAGGIVSSAIDGQNCAKSIAKRYNLDN